jgi:hypothetical protein
MIGERLEFIGAQEKLTLAFGVALINKTAAGPCDVTQRQAVGKMIRRKTDHSGVVKSGGSRPYSYARSGILDAISHNLVRSRTLRSDSAHCRTRQIAHAKQYPDCPAPC